MPSLTQSYNWLINECNDINVGYSQAYRQQQIVNGITYYDCSSIIWYSLLNGDFDVVGANNGSTYPFTTGTMGTVLEKLGFVKYDATSVEWRNGDIVWVSGHTEMVYSEQRTMGAHTDEYELKEQVSINDYNSDKSSYTYLYRYETETPTPTPIPTPSKRRRKLPVWLMLRYY